jgi:hypothetical protein
MRTPKLVLIVLAIAAIVVAAVAASQSPPLRKGGTLELEVNQPLEAAGPVHIGKTETAKWTATTYEAATSEAHKKVLKSGKVATVTGEVVDVSCYLQLGKRGEAHVACGTKCITNGQPIGLLDKSDNLYILFAEEHHPRRDGEVDLKKVFLPLLAKNVTVTGMMTEMKGYHALFVQAAEAGASLMKTEPETK